MREFNVKDIQFINRDYCQLFSKPLVYLHYISHASKYPKAAYQHVLKKEPFDNETTNESIINEFLQYEESVVNVSQKCKLLTFIKDFQLEYPGILNGLVVYPDYDVEIVNLSNGNDEMPDLGIVWEINRIAPAFCGMLFENIIAYCSNTSDNVWDLSEMMIENKSNVSNETIEGLIERNFINKRLIHRNCHVKINSKNVITLDDEKLSEEHFISLTHYLVFRSLLHFMKHDLKGNDVEVALNVLDYLKNNIELFDTYIEEMRNSTFVKNMNKWTKLQHGIIKRDSKLSGEVDFISDQAIVDIKCYKEEELDNWFGQLWLYGKLFGKRQNLWIVNVYNNKIYKFSQK